MPDWKLRSATSADIDELVLLEHEVERALPCREMFATDGPEFYEPIVAGAGHILLACDECGIAGASVIRFPSSEDEENLGHSLSLSSSLHERVRHLESVFLRPDCRGRNLAEKLIRMNMEITNSAGRDISLATVWPLNIPSLRLHLGLGMYIRGYALKYGGKPRFILMDDGSRPELGNAPLFIPAEDFNAHDLHLKSGMLGVAVHRKGTAAHIEYRKLAQ